LTIPNIKNTLYSTFVLLGFSFDKSMKFQLEIMHCSSISGMSLQFLCHHRATSNFRNSFSPHLLVSAAPNLPFIKARRLMSSTVHGSTAITLADHSLLSLCENLASKQPTPGGGASAAIGAAIGAAAAAMSGAYTQRQRDEESGAAEAARIMITKLDISALLAMADDDVQAYQLLQSTWKKDAGLSREQIENIQANALKVPTVLVESCHKRILVVHKFLPKCNPNITSDAKVGIHQLAGAARAAYQTVLVNSPPEHEKQRLLDMMREIQTIENELMGL
jgi:methenyltetrahydrofolate cyclohydrolase